MNKQEFKEKIKSVLYDALLDKEFLLSTIEEEITKNNNNLNSEEYIKQAIKEGKDDYNEIILEDILKDLNVKEKEDYIKEFKKRRLTKKGIKQALTQDIQSLLHTKIVIENTIDKPIYKEYVIDLLENKTLKYDYFCKLDISLIYVITNKLDIYKEAIKDKELDSFLILIKFERELTKKILNKSELINKNTQPPIKYEQQTLDLINITYSNRANVRVNKITNDLSVVSNNGFYESMDYKMAQEIKTLTFNIENESIEESQNIINKLDKTDIMVLNAIIDIYKQYGINKTFTNTQIANKIYNETGQEIKKEQKEIIHKSIEKLTSTKIKIGFTSEVKGKARKLSTLDYLVKLTPLKYEATTTTYYYSIDKEPLYYQYLNLTNNNNVIEGKPYNRALLTDNIKGTKKTKQWQEVRYYLIEQFSLDLNEFILDLNTIYKIIGLDKNNKQYKTQTFRARKQLKTILERFKKEKEYNFKCIELKDNRGNLTGYKVIKM